MRRIGTSAMGIIAPIIRSGDNLSKIVSESVINASIDEDFKIEDGDIIGITEAVVAKAEGNYATIEQIAKDIRNKIKSGTVGVVFPILSRNRFSNILKGISMGSDKVIIQLSYPSDEVGNSIVTIDECDDLCVNPNTDSFTEEEFREKFGNDIKHKFTGIDYMEYYKSLGNNIEIIISNNPKEIFQYTKNVIVSDIHSRNRTKKFLKEGNIIIGLDDILSSSIDGSGYNEKYGILGSNKSTEDKLKLFPRNSSDFVKNVQELIKSKTGKVVEVMVYGDGAFKDPKGGIWEFADPVVSPGFTNGLLGMPNEIKLKYIADSELSHLEGEKLIKAIKEKIISKDKNLIGNMRSEGTTPRQITDLLGSLCDLVTGSGDKGTPIVYIKDYFKNYASE